MLSGKRVPRASHHAGQVWPRGRRASSRRSGSRARWMNGRGAVVRRRATPTVGIAPKTHAEPGRDPAGEGAAEMTSQNGPADRGESPHTVPSLSIKQVSQRLRVSYNTIRTLVLKGQLVASKFLRTY